MISGLVTCVLDWRRAQMDRRSGVAQGFNLIPVSDVREAVGGVGEAVGDEKMRRKRGRRNIQQRHHQ